MDAIADLMAALITIGTLAQLPLQAPPGAPLHVFTDHAHGCRYVVAGTDEGLHVVITGGSHCRGRILIDGTRLAPEQRAERR